MLDFKKVSLMNTGLSLFLFNSHLLTPKIVFKIFEIPLNESAFFNARRTAILYLGIGIIMFLGRNEENSKSRQAMCLGLTVIFLGLAALGIFEFARGYAGVGLLSAVIIELFFGINYLKIWMSNK